MAAHAIESRGGLKKSARGKAEADVVIDAAVKSLIDELIVPKLVEEFLSRYGPASVVETEKSTGRNTQLKSDSEPD